MREIKFRVWDVKKKKLLSIDEVNTGIKKIYLDGFVDADLHGYEIVLEKEGVELYMYTGLKDKNGKEIYEGDILQCHFVVAFVDASDGANLGMSVGWYEQRDNFESFRQLEVGDELEVIGNIYENPELLGGE